MNFRQKNTATGVVLALAFALAIAVTPVFAVHDLDIFELEGNTVDAVPDVAPNNPDILSPNAQDWNNLIGLNGGLPAPITPTPPGGLFSGIVRDGLTGGALSGTGDQHLTQGSKNINDLDTWQTSTSGQTPGKDDLLASMSATYTNPANNNSLLYFAATRRESNGNATLGLWFFQRPINVNPEDGSFSDVHQDGDLFLISTFTEGGGASVIQAFKWIGNGLTDVTSSLGLECTDPLTTGYGACAIVNSSPITIPTLLNVTGGGWPGFPNNVVPAGRFFEGGIVSTRYSRREFPVSVRSCSRPSPPRISGKRPPKTFCWVNSIRAKSMSSKRVVNPSRLRDRHDHVHDRRNHHQYRRRAGDQFSDHGCACA